MQASGEAIHFRVNPYVVAESTLTGRGTIGTSCKRGRVKREVMKLVCYSACVSINYCTGVFGTIPSVLKRSP